MKFDFHCAKCKIKSVSVQHRVKKELIESGFIAENPFFGNRKKGSRLRLIDEYSIFYLKWQKEMNNSRLPVRPDYWMMLQNSNTWKTWPGYAFENVCLNHIPQLGKALGISGIIYSFSTWYYISKRGNDMGVQIDILIDRSDNCINLCEVKYHNGQFTVSKEYAKKLLYKKQKFIEVTKTKKSVFITMITNYGVKENRFYTQAVNNQLILDELFQAL